MSQAHAGHAATLLQNGQVLVAGGGATALAGCELYTPSNGKWTVTGSMNVGREGHALTLLQSGHVLVLGGGNPTTDMLASAELYNPATIRSGQPERGRAYDSSYCS